MYASDGDTFFAYMTRGIGMSWSGCGESGRGQGFSCFSLTVGGKGIFFADEQTWRVLVTLYVFFLYPYVFVGERKVAQSVSSDEVRILALSATFSWKQEDV